MRRDFGESIFERSDFCPNHRSLTLTARKSVTEPDALWQIWLAGGSACPTSACQPASSTESVLFGPRFSVTLPIVVSLPHHTIEKVQVSPFSRRQGLESSCTILGVVPLGPKRLTIAWRTPDSKSQG